MTPSQIRLEHLARLGFAARGVVYCLVGGLALLAAIGSGGSTSGGKSALGSLLGQPFGVVLLLSVALGLAFFAIWRIAEGVTDADGHGSDPKGLGTRALHVLSGLANGGLAVSALDLALGFGAGGGDDKAAQDWTEWLLAEPFGAFLVAGIGIGVVLGGAFQLWKAAQGDVLKRLATPAGRREFAKTLGRLGYGARGVTFGLIGLFLLLAALHGNSNEVKGLGGALQWLEAQPFGWAPLGAVALGLFAFGAFGFVQALYRRIDVPGVDDAKRALGA